MRFLFSILILAILAGIAEWFFPWWTAAIVAILVGYFSGLSAGKAFLAGFMGIGLLWLGFVLWRDIPNEHLLASRMAALLHIGSYAVFDFVTALLGGLIGGLAAWSGSLLHRKQKPQPVG